MILRRLTQSIRKQDWFAVVIETLIVVLGVFLGLQASNWNDSRETDQRAKDFSERLTADLTYEAWSYEYLIDYNKDVRAAAKAALDSLADKVQMTDEQFLINVYRATQYKYNDRNRATFDELIATGDIGLIEDEKLRRTAIFLYTTTLIDVIAEEGRGAPVREIFRRRVTADVQEALLDSCGDRYAPSLDYEAIVGSLAYDCALDLPAPDIAASADALRASEGLVEALQIRFADVETAITDLEKVNADVFAELRRIAGTSS